MKFKVLFATVLLTLCAAASGEIYKWVDNDGNVHYSDKPPATRAEKLDIPSRPTDLERIAAIDAQRREQDVTRETIVAAESERQRIEGEQATLRTENCDKARRALASLISATRVYEPLPDGGRRYLEQDEVDAKLAAARTDVDKWCTPDT